MAHEVSKTKVRGKGRETALVRCGSSAAGGQSGEPLARVGAVLRGTAVKCGPNSDRRVRCKHKANCTSLLSNGFTLRGWES